MDKKTKIKKYPPRTAGRLMITNVPVLNERKRVVEAQKLFVEGLVCFDITSYIYIVGKARKLKNVISTFELFQAPKKMTLRKFPQKELVMAQPLTDQEHIARLALKNNIRSIPIVSRKGVFIGAIPSDAILKILHEESSEDILKFGGIVDGQPGFDDIFKIPIIKSLKHRAPWLILGLFGGIFAAGIVNHFHGVLSKNLILAAFIPLIVYMADAVGTQMEAFIIRDLAINPKMKFLKYLARQASIVLVMGLFISVLVYFISLGLYTEPKVSLVLGISLFCAILTSLITGLIVPFTFSRFRLDPANASGPVATITQDVLSVTVYFIVATLLL